MAQLPPGFVLDEKPDGFNRWYAKHAKAQGLSPNPDAPEHFYDYRAAYRAGATPDESGHWPSEFKREGHPRLVIDGVDTRNGLPAGFVLDAEPQAPQGGIGRQLGLTARHVVEGAAGVAGIVADPLGVTLDAIIPNRRGVADVVAGRGAGPRYIPLRQNVSALLDRIGLPSPQTPTERVVGAASQALVGGGGFVRGGQLLANQAPGLARQAGRFLASSPGTQGASAITGAGSAEIARERGASPGAQMVAGVVGGLVPGVGMTAIPAAGRGAMRGGEAGRQRVEDNVRLFNQVGATPSAGQATESRFLRAMESFLARIPGGSGRIIATAEKQADDLGAGVEQIANRLSPAQGAAKAGLSVERGIRGDGGFVESFKARSRELYGAVDQHVPKDSPVAMARTSAVLDELSKPIAGAEATSAVLANPKLAGIREGITKDLEAGSGKLPYEAVKGIRTRIGEMLADSALVADFPKAQVKRLYRALTEDIEAQAGKNPAGLAAIKRANNYYSAGMKRLEVLERVIEKSGGPEAVFKAATAGTKEGAFVLRSVMQSLPKENQKDLASAIVRRLGRAVSSKQGAEGETFSTETFLTNWNNLSQEAKITVFNRFGPQFRQDMDKVAKVAANLREGSGVFANPSGTGQAVAQASTATAAIVSFLTGQWQALGAIATGVTAANATARLMTNPRFVAWLAQSTKVPASALSQQIVILDSIAKREGDEDVAGFAEALRSASQEQTQQQGPEG